MSNFKKKRLQVFVSSTYTDLREERQAAVEAILNAGHIPAGMELFAANDESQTQVIRRWIDESDVFLLILGFRYGSMELKSGKSYTQLEYEYAVKSGKPFFACVIDESLKEERVKLKGTSCLEMENPKLYKDFRTLAESRIVSHWKDIKDIKLAVLSSLSEFEKNKPLLGWVHGSQVADYKTLSEEMVRLSSENAQLRAKVSEMEEIIKKQNELANKEESIETIISSMKDEEVSMKFSCIVKREDCKVCIKNLLGFFAFFSTGFINNWTEQEFEAAGSVIIDEKNNSSKDNEPATLFENMHFLNLIEELMVLEIIKKNKILVKTDNRSYRTQEFIISYEITSFGKAIIKNIPRDHSDLYEIKPY